MKKNDIETRLQKLEKSVTSMLYQIQKPREKTTTSKLLSISDVLNADERFKYIVIGTLWNAMKISGVVDVNNCDDIREEFDKRGWVPLSKNDVQYTPYIEWQWYVIHVIFTLAAKKALGVAQNVHNLNYEITHSRNMKTSAELIAEFDNITKKQQENETKNE